MQIYLFLAVVLMAVPSTQAIACAFNTDCQPGSRCVKPVGSLYGYFMGGLFPGNSYDRQPAYNPLDLTRRQSNTCSFNVDCGPGGRCMKSAGSIYRTCL